MTPFALRVRGGGPAAPAWGEANRSALRVRGDGPIGPFRTSRPGRGGPAARGDQWDVADSSWTPARVPFPFLLATLPTGTAPLLTAPGRRHLARREV